MPISEDFPYVGVTFTAVERRVETKEARISRRQWRLAVGCVGALCVGVVLGATGAQLFGPAYAPQSIIAEAPDSDGGIPFAPMRPVVIDSLVLAEGSPQEVRLKRQIISRLGLTTATLAQPRKTRQR